MSLLEIWLPFFRELERSSPVAKKKMPIFEKIFEKFLYFGFSDDEQCCGKLGDGRF